MSPRFTTAVHGSTIPVDHSLHIVANVGGERFAFSVSHVEEAVDAPTVEWVPVAPAGMLGQLMHRGHMVSAWDAGWAFHLPRAATAGAALVLRDGSRRIAIVVDDVIEMARIESADLREVPGSADLDGVLSGVCLAKKGGATRENLVNVVRVEALAAVLSSVAPRGTFAEGMTQ
jgi:chemotaxis signal transduction protein